MNDQLYRKVGRKYVKIGYSDGYYGFPCDGLWVVYSNPGSKASSCIGQVGKLKEVNYEQLASLVAAKENDCSKALLEEKYRKELSANEIVRIIFEELCKRKDNESNT
jgi:hypothetical protein